MTLRLSPEDAHEYRVRVEAHDRLKQVATREGDKAGARRLRQAIGRLYDEYAARQLPPEPPNAWEVEQRLTDRERLDRVERLLCLLVRAQDGNDWKAAVTEARAALAEVIVY